LNPSKCDSKLLEANPASESLAVHTSGVAPEHQHVAAGGLNGKAESMPFSAKKYAKKTPFTWAKTMSPNFAPYSQ